MVWKKFNLFSSLVGPSIMHSSFSLSPQEAGERTTQVSLHEQSRFSLDVREHHSNANHQDSQLPRGLAGSPPVCTMTDIFFFFTYCNIQK